MNPIVEDEAMVAVETFPATTDGMVTAQAYLERYYDDPKPAIIMDEIVSNIVRCSGAKTFTLKFVSANGESMMVFIDDGKPFDPTSEIKDPDVSAAIDERDVGGLGMFMVKKMSKAVSYRRVGDNNELTVVI